MKKWKLIIFFVVILIGIALLLIGAIKLDDVAQIRMEGSEL